MILKQIAISIIVFLLLLMWYLTYKVSCVSIIILLVIGFILSKTNYEYVNAKKICLANCYFKQNSFFFRLLTKKALIFIFSIISGTILSMILLLNIVVFNFIDFLILFLDIILIIYLYNSFSQNNSLKLKDDIKEPIVKNSVAIVNSIVVSMIFVIINLYQIPPSYIQNDLFETTKLVSNQIYSNCLVIDTITRLSNEIISIKWWIMLNLTINSNSYFLKLFIWIIYLLGNYLMIFAFSRLNLELLDILKRWFKDESK